MKELLSFMHEDCIAPNAQTFAAVFECIERSASDHLPLLHFYYRQMQDKVGRGLIWRHKEIVDG